MTGTSLTVNMPATLFTTSNPSTTISITLDEPPPDGASVTGWSVNFDLRYDDGLPDDWTIDHPATSGTFTEDHIITSNITYRDELTVTGLIVELAGSLVTISFNMTGMRTTFRSDGTFTLSSYTIELTGNVILSSAVSFENDVTIYKFSGCDAGPRNLRFLPPSVADHRQRTQRNAARRHLRCCH